MDGRLTILILADHAMAEGGAPQVAIASARALANRGHAVIYIHAVGEAGDPLLEGVPNLTRIGLGEADIWDKPALRAVRDGLWNHAAARKLGAILARHRNGHALVHVHQWTRGFSPAIFAAIRAAGLPLVISMHDYFIACPTGLKFRFDRAEPCALTPMSGACVLAPCDPKSRAHKAIRLARTFAAGRALAGHDVTAIHVSEAGRGVIGADLPRRWRQVVIENPIATEPAPAPRAHPGAKIVHCGRLTEEKGVLLIARAARTLDLPALFVGEGPMREAILAENPAAEITGWLPRDQVRARLAEEARVLVAPALWPETGPMVVAEAQALGVPVIVSGRAGASGRVRDGVDGFVLPPEQAALESALHRLSEDARALEMGKAAWEAFSAEPPSPDAHAAKLEAVYRQMLAGR
jgi:glycosyltransferase involved in cell wall biosynthesis